MISKEIMLSISTGMESKTAAKFIQKAAAFKSSVYLEYENKEANAKSLLGVLSLGLSKGSKIKLIIEGVDQEQAMDELSKFISSGFIE